MSLNGFTKQHILDLYIQNTLNIDSNGDNTKWIIQEADNGDLQFIYDGVIIFTIDTITGGAVSSIQDADNTTSITTQAIAENLVFTTNSNERMRIDSNGLVGLGIAIPTSRLHIHEPTAITSRLQLTNSVSGSTINDGIYLGIDASQQALFFNQETTSMIFGTNNTARLTIESGGDLRIPNNVSIGTNNAPLINLAIGDANTGLNQEAEDELAIYTGGSERVRFDSVGNIGIGTNSPLVRLHIENEADLNTMIVGTGSSAINRRSNIQFRSTFGSGGDTGQRRCGDILTGFNAGTWGTEYMSFNVGNNGAANDAAVLTDEKMRILDSGIIQIGDNVNSGAKLDLTGLNDMLRMTNTAGEFLLGVDNLNITYMKSSNGAIKITNNSSSNTTATLSIGDISGNPFIGINTEAPTEILSVIGTNFDYFLGDTIGGNIRSFLRGAGAPIFAVQDTGNSIFGLQATNGNNLVLGALSGNDLLNGVVIDNTNNVSINTTNSSGKLHIAADFNVIFVEGNDLVPGTNKLVRVENKSVEVMYIESDGDLFNTNGTYGTISDIRVKQNITVANSQWNDLKAIEFVNYELIKHPGKTLLGVKAQQVETIAPGLIKNTIHSQEINGETVENIKQVKQSVLFMKGMIALQEAQERIETLETQNSLLMGLITDLSNRLSVLEGN